MQLTREEFEAVVEEALRRIPEEFRRHLPEISVLVRDRPTRSMLDDTGVPAGETLLGLYEGTPRSERSVTDPLRYPDTIWLFQRPLEEACGNREELDEEIRITVAHEMAHYLGIDDERLEELGYG